jgi:hypothetical protein
MVLLTSPQALTTIQIFSIPTFDAALSLARLDRPKEIVQSMLIFDAAAKEIGSAVTPFSIRKAIPKLEAVLKLTPNHLSAKFLLQYANGTFPNRLSVRSAVERIFSIARPVLQVVSPERPAYHFTSSTYRRVAERLKRIEKIMPPDATDIFYGVQAFIGSVEDYDTFYEEIPSLGNAGALTAYVQANRKDSGRMSRLESIVKQIGTLGKAVDRLFTDTDYVKKLWR